VTLLRICGIIALLVGVVWIIQGFGLLPTGSFMDGQAVWGLIGLGCFAAGVVALAFARRRRMQGPPEP
jgi:hypothetical protein